MNGYPLMERDAELAAASGRPLHEVTLEALADGRLQPGDLTVDGETLRRQAAIAREAGYVQLAENLTRAAELTAVPNQELLQMYELLRPGRSGFEQLIDLAKRLESSYAAPVTAAFVREAAAVYRRRQLCRPAG